MCKICTFLTYRKFPIHDAYSKEAITGNVCSVPSSTFDVLFSWSIIKSVWHTVPNLLISQFGGSVSDNEMPELAK